MTPAAPTPLARWLRVGSRGQFCPHPPRLFPRGQIARAPQKWFCAPAPASAAPLPGLFPRFASCRRAAPWLARLVRSGGRARRRFAGSIRRIAPAVSPGPCASSPALSLGLGARCRAPAALAASAALALALALRGRAALALAALRARALRFASARGGLVASPRWASSLAPPCGAPRASGPAAPCPGPHGGCAAFSPSGGRGFGCARGLPRLLGAFSVVRCCVGGFSPAPPRPAVPAGDSGERKARRGFHLAALFPGCRGHTRAPVGRFAAVDNP